MITKHCFLSLFTSLLLCLIASAAELRGVIIRADAAKNQLTVEGRGIGVRGVIMSFELSKDTQLQVGRKPAQLADLSIGRRVRVVYELQGDRRVALLITLQGGQPSPVPPGVAGVNQADTVSGTLRRVSFTEREIVVISPAVQAGEEVETTVSIPEDAKIIKDQKAVAFDVLREGDQVLVQVEKRDGKLWAKSIQVGAGAAANPKAASEPSPIERVRKALKLVDFVLQMIDQKSR